MFVGIISYLPDDSEKRQSRIEMRDASIESIRKLFDDSEIHVNAQNYKKKKEYIKGINYDFDNESGIGCSSARNQLLDLFYESNEDFAILLDDDTVLHDTPSVKYLVSLLKSNSESLKDVDAISGKDIGSTEIVLSNQEVIDFDPMPFCGLNGLLIIRNFNKYYQTREYYTDVPTEDLYFRIDALTKYKSYYCEQLIYDGFVGGVSSTLGDWSSSQEEYDHYDEGFRIVCNKFNIPKNAQGQYKFSEYHPQVNVESLSIPVEGLSVLERIYSLYRKIDNKKPRKNKFLPKK